MLSLSLTSSRSCPALVNPLPFSSWIWDQNNMSNQQVDIMETEPEAALFQVKNKCVCSDESSSTGRVCEQP